MVQFIDISLLCTSTSINVPKPQIQKKCRPLGHNYSGDGSDHDGEHDDDHDDHGTLGAVVAVAAAAADSSAVEYVRLMKICMGLTELSLERHGALQKVIITDLFIKEIKCLPW
jgi:hypothetical protein